MVSFDFVDEEEMHEYKEMLEALLDLDSGMTGWELGFIDDLWDNWDGPFTVKQAETIEKVYERLFS